MLFLAHLDVVEARREDWTVEPFKLTERDGYFYGRGTMDTRSHQSKVLIMESPALRLDRACYRGVSPAVAHAGPAVVT